MPKRNMKIEIATAAPYLTFPKHGEEQFKYEMPKENHILYDHVIKYGEPSIILGYDAYTVFNPSTREGTITLVKDGWVIFCILFCTMLKDDQKFIDSKLLHNKKLFETSQIWQDRHYKGLARKMLSYVMTQTDALITSDDQWPNGRDMWQKFVQTEFNNFSFYATLNKGLQKIKEADLSNLNQFWSSIDASFRNVRIVVIRDRP